MSNERKLSLVKPLPPASAAAPVAPLLPDLPDDEPEVTDDELRHAEALRKALDHGGETAAAEIAGDAAAHAQSRAALDPMALALRVAWRPEGLGADDLEAILSRAMGDVDAAATRSEEKEAAVLRDVLEEHDAERSGKLVRGPGAKLVAGEDSAELAVALRAAWSPSAVPIAKHELLMVRALDAAGLTPGVADPAAEAPVASPLAVLDPPWRGIHALPAANNAGDKAPLSLRRFRIGPRTFATMTGVVAMAAAVFLLVGRIGQHDEAPAAVAQAPAPAANAAGLAVKSDLAARAPRIASRSTTDLFDASTPFPRSGGESARVDRIAVARAADLRANRFAAWGVR